jgi:MFS family permease
MQEPKLSSEQIEAIADENGEVYRRDVFKTAWKTRSQTLWSGGALGILVGGTIGALTALAGVIAGASAIFFPVVGAFAIAGMVMGVAAFTATGASVGSVVGGEKVKDRKKLQDSPADGLQESISYRGTVNEKATFWNRIVPFTRGSKKIYNWKAGLALGAAGLALGALLIATGGSAIVVGALHAAAVGALSKTAITAMTLTATTLFGAVFGLDMGTIGANVTEFIAGIFSGKIFEHDRKASAQEACVAPVPPRLFLKSRPKRRCCSIKGYAAPPEKRISPRSSPINRRRPHLPTYKSNRSVNTYA